MMKIKTINRIMRIFFTYLIIFFCLVTNVQADSFNDDFSIDTTADYTVADTWTIGGTGQFLYDATGERAQVLTGNNIALQFSHSLPASESGIFSIDFLPTQKHPEGGAIFLRLVQDDNNYYELINTNGYGPYGIKKVVNGIEVDTASLQNEYMQSHNYQLTIHYSPAVTTVEAFNEVILMNSHSGSIMVNSFEIETMQQDAYYDNIIYNDRECDFNEDCSFFDDACNVGVCTIDDNSNSACSIDIRPEYCDDINSCTDDSCVAGQCVNECNATYYNDSCCANPACASAPACATSRVAGALVLYAFGEGTGTTVNDVSGNGTPLNLTIADESAISWIPGGGLSINAATIIDSGVPATKVIDAVKTNNQITIEAWIAPADISQDGPARIVTLSDDTGNRNFTLAQGLWDSQPSDLFDVRLRTTTTSNNGFPSLSSSSGSLTTNLTHLVYTRNALGEAKIYINGIEETSGTVNGDCSNWDESYLLALGNEITEDRPWRGELHLVAIYNQALSQNEVEQNYLIGITETICDDGIDNDGDGKTDCIDSDCEGITCDDGFYCTVDDVCAGDECVGISRDCDDGEFCNGVEYCDEDNDLCEYSGNPCPWLCNEEEDLCLIPSPPPQYCKMVISPSIETVTSGDSVEFTAVTTCNGIEFKGNYQWEVTSTIGSSIDESTGLYTAGENAGTDIIKVNDTLHYYISATLVVDVIPEIPPLPAVCDISIEPSTATIDSEGSITFTATLPEREGCLEPDYTWQIETDIHSKITPGASTCFYQAGSNKTGILFTDTITVIDNANGTSTEATVTILYGKVLGVFPKVLFTSRWIPLPQIMFIIGENTRFNCTSYVTCTPNDSICVIGQIGLGNIMLAFVLIPPNTEESFVDISVTTTNGNGEDVTFTKANAFSINPLPFTLVENENHY